MNEASIALAALRSAVAERDGDLALCPGFSDQEMDGWGVPVPETVRQVLRAAGGLEADGDVFSFGPCDVDEDSGVLLLDWYEEIVVGAAPAGPHRPGQAEGDDWGPVLRKEYGDIVIEAATFSDWLISLARHLADGGDPADRPAPRSTTRAVPSIEVAEGQDRELAALVGRGHSLTDVVDLRTVPAYPCSLPGWRPYFSSGDGTADTSGSTLSYRVLGGGRLLALESVVSGDFVLPVRRHSLPGDAAARAVAELEELAAAAPAYVRLEPADPSAETASVPEEIRILRAAIGGLGVAGLPRLDLAQGPRSTDVDPVVHRMIGGDGTYHPLAQVTYRGQRALVHVRVDRRTGAWGPVVSVPADPDRLRRHPELTLLSDNLPRFLLDLARIGREAARSPDFARSVRHATRWFSPNTGQPWIRPLSTVEWEQSGYDTAVLDGLPPGSHLAVLSGMPLPSDLCFHRAPHWSYGRPLERLDFLTPDLVLAIPTRQGDTSH